MAHNPTGLPSTSSGHSVHLLSGSVPPQKDADHGGECSHVCPQPPGVEVFASWARRQRRMENPILSVIPLSQTSEMATLDFILVEKELKSHQPWQRVAFL